MKKILVPTDFSDFSLEVVETAAALARKFDACICLLHAVELPGYELNDRTSFYRESKEEEAIAERVKKEFAALKKKAFLKDLTVAEIFVFDNVRDAIVAKAKEHEVNLIVMGSHGSKGWNEQFVGSSTARVIRMAKCPVLTIKEGNSLFEPKEVVFASNFYGEAKESFGKIKAFTEMFDARLHLLKVVTPGRFENTRYTQKLIEDFACEMQLNNYTTNVYNADNLENGVLQFSEFIGADMITMETHGRTGLNHLISGSLTEDLANHAQCPMLSIKIPKGQEVEGVIFPI